MSTNRPLLPLAFLTCLAAPWASALAVPFDGSGYTLADLELEDRWIVVRPAGLDCSAPLSGWSVSPLFTADSVGHLPAELARYCVLERGAAHGDPSATYGDADPDVLAVAPMASPSAAALAASFVNQVRPFPDYTVAPRDKSWLVLVDTSPTAPPGDPDALAVAGTSLHGQQLATLALRATCDGEPGAPSTDCVVDIGTQLALGYTMTPTGPDLSPTGGDFGSQAHLAAAVQAAVVGWQDAPDRGPLVLNLSVAWNAEANGSGPTLSAPLQAIHTALEVASCKDATVVSSVGNLDTPADLPMSRGPLQPAAWESEPRPTAGRCAALLGSWFTPDDLARHARGGTPYTPLLYGASGVDVSRRTLGNQRLDATTPHAAPASHLVAYNPEVGAYSQAISGTSVGSIVVASAAAVLRAHAPDLSTPEIMALLREGSASSNVPADTCHGTAGTCPDVSWISVCEPLERACSLGLASTCGRGYATACEAAWDAAPILPAAPAPPTTVDLTGATAIGTCAGGDLFATTQASFTYGCPGYELWGATALPITIPQPTGGECPLCPVFHQLSGDRIELTTTTDLSLLHDLSVTVEFANRDPAHFTIGQVLSGTSAVIELPANTFDASVTKVLFSYRLDGEAVARVETLYLTW